MNLVERKGQVSVELVLIGVLSVAVITLILNVLKEKDVVAGLTLRPWNNYISGMIENGVWGPAEAMRALHPHGFKRHSSVQGRPIQ